ncbi:hypothetical protein [Thalassomonas haliotis]|uniref:Tail fiber protein n=1 Tax=Thalassomonas haliotis TaxID=485448 RepID=A0ABY7VBX1_9GAMM|nr:hypothetical protein [Thalassomonas haliotis]WDE11148.1 hypothetical protein H3N35_23395 [Thalassomonas haliotis]
MATNISASVQSLLTKLKAGAEAQMTAEELLLLSKAVQALSDNKDFEQSLIAIAEQHLDTAEQSMVDAVAQAVANMTTAKDGVNNAASALADAKTTFDSKTDELSLVNELRNMIAGLRRREDGAIGNTYNLTVLDGETEIIDEGLGHCPSQSVIFSDNGQVNICSSAHNETTGGSAAVQYTHNWYELAAGSDFHRGTFTRKNYMGCSSNSPRTSHTHRYGYKPVAGEYPLARSGDADNIQFSQVCADHSTASQTHANWRGVGLYYDANYGVAEGHYNDALVTDKYGRKATQTSDRTVNFPITAFYDNSKNCLAVIESLKVWYLYSDGWVDPNIPAFANLSFAQVWVDAQEDMFLVALRGPGATNPAHPLRYNAHYDKTELNGQTGQYAEATIGLLGSTTSGDADPNHYYNRSGLNFITSECGTDERVNTSSGWTGSQTFLWETATKTLVPVFNELVAEIVGDTHLGSNTSLGHAEWAKVKLNAKAIRMDTQKILGECVHIVQTKGNGSYRGVYHIDIPHYNPYADAWLFSHTQYRGSAYYYKFARLSRASRYHGIRGEYK